MDNRLLDMVAFKSLETMPTKQEFIATIARLLNQVTPATPLAAHHACLDVDPVQACMQQGIVILHAFYSGYAGRHCC